MTINATCDYGFLFSDGILAYHHIETSTGSSGIISRFVHIRFTSTTQVCTYILIYLSLQQTLAYMENISE